MIEGFYNQQLESSHKRLYELIQQLIQLVPALPWCMCVCACGGACACVRAAVRVRAVVCVRSCMCGGVLCAHEAYMGCSWNARAQGLMESYVPNEYPSLDKTPRVAFLGGSLDAVLLDSDDEDAADKLSTALFFPIKYETRNINTNNNNGLFYNSYCGACRRRIRSRTGCAAEGEARQEERKTTEQKAKKEEQEEQEEETRRI
jgi:hypothetical protein